MILSSSLNFVPNFFGRFRFYSAGTQLDKLHLMNHGMASITHPPSSIPVLNVSRLHHKRLKLWKFQNLPCRSNFPCFAKKLSTISYSNVSPWEPAPITYAPENEENILKDPGNIFEAMNTSDEPTETSLTNAEHHVDTKNPSFMYLRWPLWLLGPALLLATGVVPTLWLPVSSIFLGPNMASLLSLTGLDCIFNLGATLFLLMADSTARPSNTRNCITKPPSSYQFYNIIANVIGFIIPLAMLFGAQKGFLQPQLPFISFLVLLGPYFLLLSVQMITEMLTWHWQSPVWLVTPVVYEAYRLLQLMRGLKLGAELGAPSWTVHTVRGLVCGWVLVLGVQLMRVAWYAGFTARTYQQQSDG
ncbi:hypothetical protein BUALT_Bualt19G0018500 [Buddleja alternifolia]|uniref:DUF7733 domain-containing protein n=1 Tax=Buddleja alternifolia TaxID=168488 RepID=A0AAV6VZL8_9LAMI|nr:hypothetical protein BUALT_Bualt19G0018500 [Buddleja alternifolia]